MKKKFRIINLRMRLERKMLKNLLKLTRTLLNYQRRNRINNKLKLKFQNKKRKTDKINRKMEEPPFF